MLEGVALKQEVIAHDDVVHGNIGASAFGIEYNVIALDIAQSYVAVLGASCSSILSNEIANNYITIFYYSANGTVQGA